MAYFFDRISPMLDRSELIKLFHADGVITRGDYTLSSGANSDVYINAKLITLHSRGLRIIAQMIRDIWHGNEFTAVGSDEGAAPITAGRRLLVSSDLRL